MSKISGITLALLMAASAFIVSCGKTASTGSELQIVSGTVASDDLYKRTYTSIASIRYKGAHICGGTLIAAARVFTAASCLNKYSAADVKNNVTVVLGTNNISAPAAGFIYKVLGYTPDQGYKQGNPLNNMAVITLARASTLKPAIKNADSAIPAVNQGFFVAGWGAIAQGKAQSKKLLYTVVKVLPNDKCTKVYGNKFNSNNICVAEEGKGACSGDEGAPLFIRDNAGITLVGTYNYSKGCAQKGVPSVYSRVANYLPTPKGVAPGAAAESTEDDSEAADFSDDDYLDLDSEL